MRKFPLIPIVDLHIHPQTIGWSEVEELAMSNYRGMLEVATNYHWAAHIPVPADEVKFLWNYALHWARYAEAAHGILTKVQIAIHTLAKVLDADKLLDYMPKFINEHKDQIRAIGETGIEPTQYGGIALPYEEQMKLIEKQLLIAKEFNLPFIFHTPTYKSPTQGAWDPNLVIQREKWPEAKIEATQIDIELAKDSGIDPKLVVIDHCDSSNADIVLKDTKFYAAFSVAFVWRNVNANMVAEFIKKYGSERIIVDSDIAGNAYYDILAVPRIIRNLIRLGVDERDVRKVIYENPAKIMGIKEELNY